MAHGTSRSRSGRSRSAASGRRGAQGPSRRGGGGGAGPIVIGIVCVAAIVGVIVLATGANKSKPNEPHVSPESTGDSKVAKTPAAKKQPERPPPPNIAPSIIARAKELIGEMEADRSRGETLYEEAMKAKERGDQDTWQSKLEQAMGHFESINERWNGEVIEPISDALPTTTDWDAEEVANHFLGAEGSKMSRAIQRLAYIKKQLRAR